MATQTPAPQDLVRKAVIEVAQLPENELLIVIEMVDTYLILSERFAEGMTAGALKG